MNDYLNTPIEYLKGVGTERGSTLRKEAGIETFYHLLYYFPFRYVDRSNYVLVSQLTGNEGYVQLKGKIISMAEQGIGRAKRLKAIFEDETGKIELVWFKGVKWIKNSIQIGTVYRVYGNPKLFKGSWSISHPELTIYANVIAEKGLQPIYPSGEKLSAKGLHSKGIEKLTYELVSQISGKIKEIIPDSFRNQFQMISLQQALFQIHAPLDFKQIEKAQFRIKFEELFLLQLELLIRKKISNQKQSGFIFSEVGDYFNRFYSEQLPFQLTNAQKKVIREIRADLKSGLHMNRLLQGDVGSGKTLVALLTMILGLDNGFQAALMAPTEILAQQHFQTISILLEPLGIKTAILTGSAKSKIRKEILEYLKKGEIHILIGTHALLEPTVNFQNLGIVVIDEQHRFGVAQRAKLWKKNSSPPHILVMTATPIPRTLAMTFYGDLDVSIIDELPPGRTPIQTVHYYEQSRLKLFAFIKKQISEGRQIYIVYPLINESETLDYQNLMEGYEVIEREFPRPAYQVSIVHGKMKSEDKEFEMKLFVEGKTNIMVATTVIEVGVNVPNATVMVVESSERFGLSQLHQLRGRVGRGAAKSFCILMTGNKISQEGQKRIQTMVETNDGFRISEVDLEIRGPGDIMGTQQSGLINLKLADLARDSQLVSLTRNLARDILSADPELNRDEYRGLKKTVSEIIRSKPNWGKIS